MAYPELDRKFSILRKAFSISAVDVARQLDKIKKLSKPRDKTTVDRHLSKPDRRTEAERDDLVLAFCRILRQKHRLQIDEKAFQQNDIIAFCRRLKIDSLQAAIYLGMRIPIPDIFLESVFHPPSNMAEKYVGWYLIFRHDKEASESKDVYIQACASITDDGGGVFVYQDEWIDDNQSQSFSGVVFSVGSVTNIVGESKNRGQFTNPEIWWCGLTGTIDKYDRVEKLRGYVSDINRGGMPFTDRIVMVRVEQNEFKRVLAQKEFYADFERIRQVAGADYAAYLAAWKDVKITD